MFTTLQRNVLFSSNRGLNSIINLCNDAAALKTQASVGFSASNACQVESLGFQHLDLAWEPSLGMRRASSAWLWHESSAFGP